MILATTQINTPIAVCGTGNLSHVGTFRVKARVIADYLYRVRLAWQVGDGPMASNSWVTPVVSGSGAQWTEVDLGTITVPAVTSGTQRWTGRIEMYHTTGAFNFIVDYLTLVPVAEGYGVARATYAYSPGIVVANDSFVGTTAAAALNARVAPAGGTWATSGDATDFVFDDNLSALPADGIESIVRSTSVVETAGRYAVLGSTNYTDTQLDVRLITVASSLGGNSQGLIARWTDSSNYLRLMIPAAGTGTKVKLEQVVAGTATTLAESTWQRAFFRTIYRVRLIVFASGRALAWVFSDSGAPLLELQASSSALATSGTLATGKPGIRDVATVATSSTRRYTGFAVSTPAAEPIALYSGRTMQVRHDTTIRDDSTGVYTGRPQSYRGSRFLVPVGTSRVLVKARRNDVEAADDPNVTDATQIQIGWTPRGLAVPRS